MPVRFTLNPLICGLGLWVAAPSAAAVSLVTDAGVGFEGLLLSGTPGADVGVVFFHGRAQSPAGDVVNQLRQQLNADGYTTLSIDNPVPSGGAGFANYLSMEATVDDLVFDYANTAIRYLEGQGVDRIVLAGFSLGSRFATATAAAWEQGLFDGNGSRLLGLMGVGMYTNIQTGDGSVVTDPTPANPAAAGDINVFDTHHNLALIDSLPVLDVYADLDSMAAGSIAAGRLAAFGGDPGRYTRASVACPDFVNGSFSTVNGGQPVLYNENRCHQMRNGYLSGDAVLAGDVAVRLRGLADAPLESVASAWMAANAPLSAVPLPGAPLLLLSGLLALLGVARRR